jgi:hypothetical protein
MGDLIVSEEEAMVKIAQYIPWGMDILWQEGSTSP